MASPHDKLIKLVLSRPEHARSELEGEAGVLVRQLTRRFGPLSFDVRRKVEQGSEADLARWVEQVLEAKTLEDVFR